MNDWYVDVKTPNGVKKVFFYRSKRNPLKEHSEIFGHKFISIGNSKTIFDFVDRSKIPEKAIEKNDIRYAINELDTDTKYYILDCYDELKEHFPAVPDVVGHSNPTLFVAVPRNQIITIYSE